MTIKTGNVTDRRVLHFNSLDEIAADVEGLANRKLKALGNWSPGQILTHLARTMNGSIDGMGFTVIWPIRVMGWLFRRGMLSKPMGAGFQLPKRAAAVLVPGETSWEDGLRQFREAVQRQKTESTRAPNPVLGSLTREEWEQLHCRHSELHLSFLKTVE